MRLHLFPRSPASTTPQSPSSALRFLKAPPEQPSASARDGPFKKEEALALAHLPLFVILETAQTRPPPVRHLARSSCAAVSAQHSAQPRRLGTGPAMFHTRRKRTLAVAALSPAVSPTDAERRSYFFNFPLYEPRRENMAVAAECLQSKKGKSPGRQRKRERERERGKKRHGGRPSRRITHCLPVGASPAPRRAEEQRHRARIKTSKRHLLGPAGP